MADVTLVAYNPEQIETLRIAGPVVRGIVLDNGLPLVEHQGEPEPERTFEGWLIEKWLTEIRSEAFRKTAEFEYLRAQWEREG